MTKPLLSIGMIVKNEERCLEKCLKALEPLRQALPCEIIIADTGSVDRTKVIANKYADIVFESDPFAVVDYLEFRERKINAHNKRQYE
jgi:glycosyltransferase involved in cell wall biosynthesis